MGRHLLLALVSVVVCAASTASVLASGIVFTKNANVWVATPDGTGAVAVTVDGTASNPYRSPSRDARGNVVAERGNEIYRFTPAGDLVGTPFGVLDPGITAAARQPLGLALSPDGQTIALFVFGTCLTRATSCAKTFFTPVSGDVRSPDYTSSSAFPTWIADGEVAMVNDPDGVLHQRLPELLAAPWFRGFTLFGDPGAGLQEYFDEVAVAPTRDKVAVTRRVCGATPDTCSGSLEVMTLGGPAPATPPTPICRFAGGTYASPTFAPDGTKLAYAGPEGVAVTDLATMASGCGTLTAQLVIPGGESPEWGPADPPAVRLPGATSGRALQTVRVVVTGRRPRLIVALARRARVTLTLVKLTPRRRVVGRTTRTFGRGTWIVAMAALPRARYELTAKEPGRSPVLRRFAIR